MTPLSTIDVQTLGIILGGIVALWTIMSGLLKIYHEVHNTRILVNVICKHLEIDPEKIIGKE